MRCFAYSLSHSIKFNNLQKVMYDNYKLSVYKDVLHLKIIPSSLELASRELTELNEGDVFIFSYGAFVSWGLNKTEEEKLCKMLENFSSEKLGANDDDEFEYSYSVDNEFKIVDDHITLPKRKAFLDKLACSYAIAQSVKLGGIEETVENIINLTKHLPDNLSQTGSIPLSRKEIRKLMGKIFIERNSINLHLDFLDAPNFFWEEIELEPYYQKIVTYLEQEKRVEVLNKQLDVMHGLLDMLGNELNNQHSTKLEWIVIMLIFVEVVLTVGKYYL